MIPAFAFTRDTTSLEPQAVAGMAREAHEFCRVIAAWLRDYREPRLAWEDGMEGTFLVKDLIPGTATPADWFTVSSIGTSDAPQIRVLEGRIACPDVTGADAAAPSITSFLRELAVPSKDFSVSDGSNVYCKITAGVMTVANAYTATDADEYVSVTVNMNAKLLRALSGEIVVMSGDPPATETEGYVLLAEISITDGAMQIRQRHRGTIFAGSVTAPYGADPEITTGFSTAAYTICDSGSAVDVEFVVVP